MITPPRTGRWPKHTQTTILMPRFGNIPNLAPKGNKQVINFKDQYWYPNYPSSNITPSTNTSCCFLVGILQRVGCCNTAAAPVTHKTVLLGTCWAPKSGPGTHPGDGHLRSTPGPAWNSPAKWRSLHGNKNTGSKMPHFVSHVFFLCQISLRTKICNISSSWYCICWICIPNFGSTCATAKTHWSFKIWFLGIRKECHPVPSNFCSETHGHGSSLDSCFVATRKNIRTFPIFGIGLNRLQTDHALPMSIYFVANILCWLQRCESEAILIRFIGSTHWVSDHWRGCHSKLCFLSFYSAPSAVASDMGRHVQRSNHVLIKACELQFLEGNVKHGYKWYQHRFVAMKRRTLLKLKKKHFLSLFWRCKSTFHPGVLAFTPGRRYVRRTNNMLRPIPWLATSYNKMVLGRMNNSW